MSQAQTSVRFVPAVVGETRIHGNRPPTLVGGLVDAVDAAGLEAAESLDFQVVADGAVLVATGLAEHVDGRSSETARPIQRHPSSRSQSVTLPASVLGEWEAAPTSIRDEPTRLLISAADGVLAFEDPTARAFALEVDLEGGE